MSIVDGLRGNDRGSGLGGSKSLVLASSDDDRRPKMVLPKSSKRSNSVFCGLSWSAPLWAKAALVIPAIVHTRRTMTDFRIGIVFPAVSRRQHPCIRTPSAGIGWDDFSGLVKFAELLEIYDYVDVNGFVTWRKSVNIR